MVRTYTRQSPILAVLAFGLGALVSAGCAPQAAPTPTQHSENDVGPLPQVAAPTATPDFEVTAQAGVEATLTVIPTATSPPTATATLIPTATPVPIPNSTLSPTATPLPTATPTPVPVLAPQVTDVVATNFGVRVNFQVYLPGEANDRAIKRVMITTPGNAPQEFIVGFSRRQGPYFLGEVFLDPFVLSRTTGEWIQQNVSFAVGEFPVRVACTGSMRPFIDCGDQVLYEPIFEDTSLAVGDVVTFRLSNDDVDIERDCPWLANTPGLDSVSALYGTQRAYIIHRIEDTVRGSHPPAFITRGDNNVLDDGCVVRKPSIVLKVADVVKDHYVIDQRGYEQHVNRYQELLEEYWTGIFRYQELRQRYDASVRDYQRMAASGAYQSTLDDYYQSLERMRVEINELVGCLNLLPGETALAQRGIEAMVAPFSVQ